MPSGGCCWSRTRQDLRRIDRTHQQGTVGWFKQFLRSIPLLRQGGSRAAALFAAAIYLLILAPGEAAASPCSGKSHTVSLDQGAVSPGSGGTTTPFVFSVLYNDSAGCPPASIVVVIAGVGTYPLAAAGTTGQWSAYRRTMTLPAGSHAYSFTASGASGGGGPVATLTSVSPAQAVVAAPTPAATPRPPVPSPTPASTPSATLKATSAPAATAAPPTAPIGASTGPTSATSFGPGSTGDAGAARPTTGPVLGGTTGGSSQPSSGPVARTSELSAGSLVSLGDLPAPVASLGVALIGILAGLVLFSILEGRFLGADGGAMTLIPIWPRGRRQDPERASTTNSDPTTEVIEPGAASITIGGAVRRRPGSNTPRDPIQFQVPKDPGVDRCRVASRLVQLRSDPDEFQGSLVGRLDVGDEVDVIRRDGASCLVRTPTGAEGWVRAMTLISIVPDPELDGST